MEQSKRIKYCVGAIIVDEAERVLLITNDKWKTPEGNDVYVVPGGEILEGETPEEALVREMKEELALPIKILYRRPGQKPKPVGGDFRDEAKTQIVFIDFFAKAVGQDVTPDPGEVKHILWDHTAEELLIMQQKQIIVMGNTMREFLQSYIAWKKERGE